MDETNSQIAKAVLMVRPSTFGFDEQTAQTNSFQHHLSLSAREVQKSANQEFDTYVDALRQQGIAVSVFDDPEKELKPNAVFPNNWLTTWPDGQVYLYPMATPSRRIERSFNALEGLSRQFKILRVSDLSSPENEGKFLESTGVMVFDHVNKIAYACISPRCDEQLFRDHAIELGYEAVAFHAYSNDGTPIYHTNVMMGVQSTTAVICAEAITDETERTQVLTKLEETGHKVIQITQAQMANFCGNVLELQNEEGKHFLVLSQRAFDNFTMEQAEQLGADKRLIPVSIPTIETIGGGSARCMIAEVFLPVRSRIAIHRDPVSQSTVAASL